MNITYNASPTIAKFHQCDAYFRGIRGPIGSGKSVGCVMEIMRRAFEMPPDRLGRRRSRWAIVRNTVAQLRDTTLKTWKEWVPEEICTITMSPRITGHIDQTLPDGTTLNVEIIFLPMDNLKSERDLLSLELTGIWFNEARELALQIVVAGLSRVGRFPKKADVPSYWSGGIADTNSPDTFHWWYKRAVESTPENWRFFDQPGALLWDEELQKFLPNPLAENVENHSKGFKYYLDMVSGAEREWIDVMVACQYKSLFTGKPVYAPAWNAGFHVAKAPLAVDPKLPVYLGFDFGLTPACVAAQMSPAGQLRILREWATEEMGLRQLLQDLVIPDLAADFGSCRKIVTFDPAGVQRSQVDKNDSCAEELARAGLPGTPARSNDFEPRRRAVINRLTYLANGEPGYLVDPRCQMLIQGFNGGYQFEVIQKVADGGQVRYKETPAKNIFSHIHDANQYLCLAMQPGMIRSQEDSGAAAAKVLRMNRLRQQSRSLLG